MHHICPRIHGFDCGVDERLARLNIIKDLLGRLHYTDKDERLTHPDPQIVFAYDISNLENGLLAK